MNQEISDTPSISTVGTAVDSLRNLAELRFAHATFRKNLQERLEGQLSVAHNGGLFKATPELISFLHCWDTDEIFLEDVYHNPIKCNRLLLLSHLQEAYQFAMNAWHIDFEASKKLRKLPRD